MLDFADPDQSPKMMLEMARLPARAASQTFTVSGASLPTSAGNLIPLARTHANRHMSGESIMYFGGGHTVIGVAGITQARQANDWLYYQYADPIVGGDAWVGYNRMAEYWSNAMWDAFQPYLLQNDHVLIGGHSAGGAAAQMLGRRIRNSKSGMQVTVFTYGEPKWCGHPFNFEFYRQRIIRVMNYGDIIPYVPPTFTQSPLFTLTLTPGQAYQNTQMLHLDGGVLITQDNRLIAQYDPAGIATPLEWSPQQTVEALQGSTAVNHFIATYISRLSLIVELQRPQPIESEPPAEAPQDRLHFPPRREVEREIRRIQQTTPFVQTVVPPVNEKGRIRVLRAARQWYVTIDNTIVYVATSRRDAQGVAGAMRGLRTQIRQNPARYTQPGVLLDQLAGVSGIGQ